MEDYNIDIEIDQDEGLVHIVKNGIGYTYSLEELQGKGVIDNLQKGNAKITVYSQKERFSIEEYMQLFGEDK